MDSLKNVSGKNVFDLFLKRLCPKGKSNSISSTIIKPSRNELYLRKGLLLC